MRNYFILDGVDSRDFGVYISGQGTFSAPQKAYTFYNIPGRNGALLGNEHRLENINVSYEAFIYTDFDNNMAAFRSFLLSLNGYRRLTDSYHPEEYRMAAFVGPFEPKVQRTNDAGSFTITFSCKPQRWLISGDTSYLWVAGGAQSFTGQELTVLASALDKSVLSWSFSVNELIAETESGSGSGHSGRFYPEISKHYLGYKEMTKPVTIYIDNKPVYYTTFSDTHITEMTIDFAAGSASITKKWMTLPQSGWVKDSTNLFKRQMTDTNIGTILSMATYYLPNRPPKICASVSDLSTETWAIARASSGWLYIKDTRYDSASDFNDNIPKMYMRYELSTPVTYSGQSIYDFDVLPSADWFTIKTSDSKYSELTMKYAQPEMSNPTAFPAQPLIRAYGNGSFTMDGITITITNATSYTDIDCEAMDCYEGSTNRNNDVSFSTYDFPTLQPGDNEVTIVSGITMVAITPRWWRV